MAGPGRLGKWHAQEPRSARAHGRTGREAAHSGKAVTKSIFGVSAPTCLERLVPRIPLAEDPGQLTPFPRTGVAGSRRERRCRQVGEEWAPRYSMRILLRIIFGV